MVVFFMIVKRFVICLRALLSNSLSSSTFSCTFFEFAGVLLVVDVICLCGLFEIYLEKDGPLRDVSAIFLRRSQSSQSLLPTNKTTDRESILTD